jgi:FMN phosphatase YigB (HAD superfamily)
VIFDVGGVLVRTTDPAPRRALEQRLGLEAGQAEYLVFHSPMGRKAQMGALPSGELWGWVKVQLGLDHAGLLDFQREFFAGDTLDDTLLEYIRSLRPRFQTAIISNAMDNLLETVTTHYPMADAFDVIVWSAAMKTMKPDAAIFAETLARLGRAPEEAVFVDDFPANVTGARAAGLHAVQYVAGMDLPAALARFGVK